MANHVAYFDKTSAQCPPLMEGEPTAYRPIMRHNGESCKAPSPLHNTTRHPMHLVISCRLVLIETRPLAADRGTERPKGPQSLCIPANKDKKNTVHTPVQPQSSSVAPAMTWRVTLSRRERIRVIETIKTPWSSTAKS